MTALLHGLLDDLTAEGDQLRATVERLGEDGWSRPTPAAGWTVATQVVHLMWTDEVAVLAAHAHQGAEAKQAWDDVVLRAIDDPTGYVDQAAFELAALPRDEVLQRWADSREGLRRALIELPAGQDAVVRPADVCRVHGDRPVHGDLGARARRLRRREGAAGADGSDQARRPPRRPDPQLSPTPSTSRSRRRRRSTSS